jgi:hypothetical protein
LREANCGDVCDVVTLTCSYPPGTTLRIVLIKLILASRHRNAARRGLPA